jgi:hypothetical protein
VGEGIPVVRLDRDQLAGSTAGRAAIAWDVDRAIEAKGCVERRQPRSELARVTLVHAPTLFGASPAEAYLVVAGTPAAVQTPLIFWASAPKAVASAELGGFPASSACPTLFRCAAKSSTADFSESFPTFFTSACNDSERPGSDDANSLGLVVIVVKAVATLRRSATTDRHATASDECDDEPPQAARNRSDVPVRTADAHRRLPTRVRIS